MSAETDIDIDTLMRKVARLGLEEEAPPLSETVHEPPELIAQKYRVERLLGRGGMGIVYGTRHVHTGKLFAIKWLVPERGQDESSIRRFMREARVGGQIEHPNVVQVYDIGQDGSAHYMVMELVDGETLAARLSQRGKLSVEELCRVLIPVMRGLHAAHLRGVVHRDLKPHNIMIAYGKGAEEVPKVLDFGVSKFCTFSGDPQSFETRSGVLLGTPQYMSPEQLRTAPVDCRTDIYALGVIAYQLLAGKLPFNAANHADLVCQILNPAPRPLREHAPGVPVALENVIKRAMALDRDARFATAEELLAALEPFADGKYVVSEGDDYASDDLISTLRGVERDEAALLARFDADPVGDTQTHTSLVPRRARRALALTVGAACIGWLSFGVPSSVRDVRRSPPTAAASVLGAAAPFPEAFSSMPRAEEELWSPAPATTTFEASESVAVGTPASPTTAPTPVTVKKPKRVSVPKVVQPVAVERPAATPQVAAPKIAKSDFR